MCEHNRKTSDRGRQHEKVKTVDMVISNLFSASEKDETLQANSLTADARSA